MDEYEYGRRGRIRIAKPISLLLLYPSLLAIDVHPWSVAAAVVVLAAPRREVRERVAVPESKPPCADGDGEIGRAGVGATHELSSWATASSLWHRFHQGMKTSAQAAPHARGTTCPGCAPGHAELMAEVSWHGATAWPPASRRS